MQTAIVTSAGVEAPKANQLSPKTEIPSSRDQALYLIQDAVQPVHVVEQVAKNHPTHNLFTQASQALDTLTSKTQTAVGIHLFFESMAKPQQSSKSTSKSKTPNTPQSKSNTSR